MIVNTRAMRVFLTLLVVFGGLGHPLAQEGAAPPPDRISPPVIATPNFWDQQQRLDQPDLPSLARVRFLTSVDFPPFNFLDRQGRLAGFNVELARAICEEIDILEVCQVEALPFDELAGALERGDGEAVIAGLAVSPDNRQRFSFTDAYFRFPARFVTPTQSELDAALAAGLPGTRIGILPGTGHEAMLRAFFPGAEAVPFATRDAMLEAVRAGEVAGAFSDGVGLSFWLSSEAAAGCCRFAGGPYLSDTFLGEGLAIAVRPSQASLAEAFDYALARLVQTGRFSELLLRYFPISAF